MRVKKLIAREGLIIISLLLLSGLSFILLKSYQTNKFNFQEIEPVIPNGQELTPQGVIFRFPENTAEEVIKQAIKRDFPKINIDDWIILDCLGKRNVTAIYDKRGNRIDNKFYSIFHEINFAYAVIFFLFIAYPAYWLIRFIIWAIKTLRDMSV